MILFFYEINVGGIIKFLSDNIWKLYFILIQLIYVFILFLKEIIYYYPNPTNKTDLMWQPLNNSEKLPVHKLDSTP